MNDSNTKISKALFKNTGIIAIGQISTKVVNFFLLPLYTALLTTSEYGLADLLTTYSGLLVIFIGLQMSQAIFRFLITVRNDQQKVEEIISTVIFGTLVVFVLFAVAFCIAQNFINLEFRWFLLIHVIVSITLQSCSGIARGLGNNTSYAVGNFISSSIILVMNVVMIAVLHKGVAGMLISYVVGPIIGAAYVFFTVSISKYISLKVVSKKQLKSILRYSLPLIPNELSWSVIHSSDRWIVSAVLTVSANGLIAVASKFSLIYTTFFSIFNASWTEQVVLHYHDEEGPEYINGMFSRMISFFASIAIGIIACMPIMFSLLVNQQFEKAYDLIPFYMIAVFFNAVIGMLSAIYLVENETGKVAISTMVAAFINIVVDIALIKVIGVYAAPISSICGYATISIWRLIDVNRRHCKIGIHRSKVLLLLIMLAITLGAYYSSSMLVQILNLAIIIGMAITVNRSFLKELILLVKK